MSKRPVAALCLALAAAACQSGDDRYARAFQIESLDQAIGGPKASAREGDFLLENDQIRVVVEQGSPSRLPLGKGGTIADIDLNRYQQEFRSGRGLDQVGQFVPVANLYQAGAEFPANVEVTRSANGAEVTAKAAGTPILPLVVGLTALLRQRFADAPTALNMYTEYEVRPGERLLRVTTTIGYGVDFCPVSESDGCPAECDDALYDDDCDCPAVAARCVADAVQVVDADPLPDRDFGGILNVILGDIPRDGGRCQVAGDCAAGQECVDVTQELGGELKVCRGPDDKDAGVLLGDMLIFAKDTDAFFRGPGFDSESDIRRLFDAGFDTLQLPLHLDTIYAVGEGVSYGYTSPQGTMLVPVLSGPFSMGAPAGYSCPTDQPGCLNNRLVRFERWLSVGEGDVSSAAEPIAKARGVELGRVTGSVVSTPSGLPLSGAQVFALADPRSLPCEGACASECDLGDLGDDELAAWSIDAVLAANRCRTRDEIFLNGRGSIESQAITDPVGDPVKDGGYTMALPPGTYVLVARSRYQLSNLGVVEVAAGRTAEASFLMPEPARLDYAILDQSGQPSPGLVTIGRCLAQGPCATDDECGGGETCQQGSCACAREKFIPLELGGSRPIDGILVSQHSVSGVGSFELPPGDYEVVFSRGPSYTIDRQDVTVEYNRTNQVTGSVALVMDRVGWSTSDFHVHAAPSLDSDVPLEYRIKGMIANDMDHFVSTDHDVVVDYSPIIQSMDVSRLVGSQIGVEVSPLDFGHFIAFPLEYLEWADGNRIIGNGAPDWHTMAPGGIFTWLREMEADDNKVLVQVAHPYGYFDAYRLDPVTLEPIDSFLTFINPVVDPSNFSGEFDAMEIMNSKNFDLLRRPTVAEVRYLSEEFDALRASFRAGEIDGQTYDHRLELIMTETAKRILHRTAEEQDAAMDGVGAELPCTCGADGDCASGLVCDPATLSCVEPPLPGSDPAPQGGMCRTMRGVVDDWFVMLNKGVVKTGISGSDVHDDEAGTLRTYVKTGTVTPPNLTSDEVNRSLRGHHAVISTGPMIRFTIGEADIGDKIAATAGQELELYVRVEKAPWYDVDRVEVYRNGRLIHWASGCQHAREGDGPEPHDHPCVAEGDAVVAFEETFTDRPDEDAWYMVTAIGIDGRTLAPVYRSVGLPRLGTSEVTQKIYDLIPLLRTFRVPRPATLFPMFPWAITNPIWVDVGDDGWNPNDSPPSWCRNADYGC
jgi:hypothetical protein